MPRKARPRPNCRGPLPAGYRHGERRTYAKGHCAGRQCARAALDYANAQRRRRLAGQTVPVALCPAEARARARQCPRCGAAVGARCVTPEGRRTGQSHRARLREPTERPQRFTEAAWAVLQAGCPYCGAEALQRCVSPVTGRVIGGSHVARQRVTQVTLQPEP